MNLILFRYYLKDIMNNQKDNNNNSGQNKGISVSSHIKPANYFNVFDHDAYVSLAERSSKIVTALYMVTDLLDGNDSLRQLVRDTSTTIMQRLFSLTHSQKTDRVEILSEIQNMLYAIISYMNVIHQNGFVSDMNHSVIGKELTILRNAVDSQITKSLPYDRKINNTTSVKEFSFRDDFFDAPADAKHVIKDTVQPTHNLKDTTEYKAPLKRTFGTQEALVKESPSYQKSALKTSVEVTKPTEKLVTGLSKSNEAKDLRKDNILKILKQKRDASINDICALFKDCSSKTIQRDLTDLIGQGLVKKAGSRRWSTYNLTY